MKAHHSSQCRICIKHIRSFRRGLCDVTSGNPSIVKLCSSQFSYYRSSRVTIYTLMFEFFRSRSHGSMCTLFQHLVINVVRRCLNQGSTDYLVKFCVQTMVLTILFSLGMSCHEFRFFFCFVFCEKQADEELFLEMFSLVDFRRTSIKLPHFLFFEALKSHVSGKTQQFMITVHTVITTAAQIMCFFSLRRSTMSFLHLFAFDAVKTTNLFQCKRCLLN